MTGITHTLSSRAFTARVAEAKRWATSSPVFINDRGTATHVLMSMADYRRLTGSEETLLDAVAMPADVPDFEFDPPKAVIGLRIPSFGEDE